MSHDIHKGDPRQVLQDHCGECEQRGKYVHVAIGHLDPPAFAAAWKRAHDWQTGRLRGGARDISEAEAPLLRALWAAAVQFEARGIPIGVPPTGF